VVFASSDAAAFAVLNPRTGAVLDLLPWTQSGQLVCSLMHPLSPRPESLCVELVEPSSPTLGKGSGLLSPSHTLDDVQDATSGRLHAATRRKVETVPFADG